MVCLGGGDVMHVGGTETEFWRTCRRLQKKPKYSQDLQNAINKGTATYGDLYKYVIESSDAFSKIREQYRLVMECIENLEDKLAQKIRCDGCRCASIPELSASDLFEKRSTKTYTSDICFRNPARALEVCNAIINYLNAYQIDSVKRPKLRNIELTIPKMSIDVDKPIESATWSSFLSAEDKVCEYVQSVEVFYDAIADALNGIFTGCKLLLS